MNIFDDIATNGAFDGREIHNLISLKLHMSFDGHELAIGTGFFYDMPNQTFLVTNWHNVSGRHPNTGKCLSDHGGVPNQLTFWVPHMLPIPVGEGGAVTWLPQTIDLYKNEENTQPVWLEHPQFGHQVDVVLIPIFPNPLFPLFPINDPSLQHDDRMQIHPSIDVFVLGFPKGMSGGGNFPIWKRGSIATDPGINLDGLPKFLIDTATRGGMSGAPVIAQKAFYVRDDDNPTDHSKMILGIGRRFVGIYSGRVGDDNFQAQLGIVWRKQVIEEIAQLVSASNATSDGSSHWN